jgi:hypothetical protein
LARIPLPDTVSALEDFVCDKTIQPVQLGCGVEAE